MLTENVLRNRSGGELPGQERAILEEAFSDARFLAAGHVAVRQGEPVEVSILLVEGFMTRHIDAADGRRHLIAVHVPGDFVDLHAYPLKKLDHDVAALTDVKVGIVKHTELAQIQHTHDHLTRRLWFLTLLDAAIHRQWIFRLSSLNAIARVAHFVCEMNARLLAVGLSDGSSFELPMTQADLGEVCSLTNVHVSRVLRQLREMELCSHRQSHIQILDLKGLASLGQFDPLYLHLNSQTAALAVGRTWSGS
ncbi:MAG: Crp/Fnr family transcriptional regulator [Haliea sp.]|nr:MAG: Crp/Fnr family transcriptional regulator [Haliea sp.]